MKSYYETELGKLYHGACEDVLVTLDSNSIDFMLTDPPYGLNFMGKKWDYDVPSIEIWQECLRVLKPGGTALIFAGSRTQHRMACNVEDAGFILKDCIMWLYGSGFPKATDISKQMDKGHEREIIGDNPNNRPNCVGKQSRSMAAPITVQPLTAPATDEAKKWNGYKSHGLKPAYEPILVCMKPNEGSYADNVLKWGVSGLNIDGGRIEGTAWKPHDATGLAKDKFFTKGEAKIVHKEPHLQGRYPANIILDEEAGRLLDEQSGELKSGAMKKPYKYTNIGYSLGAPAGETKQIHKSNQGGASRFFYCAKSSKAERNAGLSGNKQKRDESRSHGQAGTDNSYNRGVQKVTNHHPTVKPLSLLKYLLTLLKTPTGGTCLDCFAGSGSTLIACENMGIKYIGIEREKEYCVITKARIENERKQLKMF